MCFGAEAVLTLVVLACVCADLLSKCWVYTLVVTVASRIISMFFQLYLVLIFLHIIPTRLMINDQLVFLTNKNMDTSIATSQEGY